MTAEQARALWLIGGISVALVTLPVIWAIIAWRGFREK